MNVLIVDDEIYAVRTIQRCVDWAAAGVDTVLTAFNAAQAKKLFALHEVDIVITDIEMPGESGLALLGWVRENGYDSIAVCLTCHAEFAYAQEYGLPCDTRFGCNFQYHPLRRMTCSKRTLWCKTPILTQFYASVGWSY